MKKSSFFLLVGVAVFICLGVVFLFGFRTPSSQSSTSPVIPEPKKNCPPPITLPCPPSSCPPPSCPTPSAPIVAPQPPSTDSTWVKMYRDAYKNRDIVAANRGRWPPEGVGNIFFHPGQVLQYFQVASKPGIKVICETGYGPGMSAILWAHAAPAAEIHIWDIFSEFWNFQKPSVDFLKETFPGRFQFYHGDSSPEVTKWIAANPNKKCDIIVIDGDHNPNGAYKDVQALKHAATPDSVFLLDDISFDGPGNDYKRLIAEGVLREIKCHDCVDLLDTNFSFNFPLYHKKFCLAQLGPRWNA